MNEIFNRQRILGNFLFLIIYLVIGLFFGALFSIIIDYNAFTLTYIYGLIFWYGVFASFSDNREALIQGLHVIVFGIIGFSSALLF